MVKKGRMAPKIAQTEEKRPSGKTYSLTKEELAQLNNRASTKERYGYLMDLIGSDIQRYVDLVIRKRLNIPVEVTPQISFQNGTIFVPDPVKAEPKPAELEEKPKPELKVARPGAANIEAKKK